jgi:exonuclease III
MNCDLEYRYIKQVCINCPLKNSRLIRVVSINVAGAIKEKFEYLRNFLTEIEADIAVICESGLIGNDREKSGDWSIVEKILTEWNCVILDATINKEGKKRRKVGGVMVLYQKKIIPFVKVVRIHDELRAIELILNDKDERNRDESCRILGVYAPSDRKEKGKYWDKWFEKTVDFVDMPTIIIGDLNVHPSEKLDVKRSKSENMQSEINEFNEFMDTGWIDAWRERNPDKRQYTFFRNGRNNGVVESRIDFCLADGIANESIREVFIFEETPMISPDHKAILVDIEYGNKIAEVLQSKNDIPIIKEEKINLANFEDEKLEEFRKKLQEIDLKELTLEEMDERIREKMENNAKELFGTKIVVRNMNRNGVKVSKKFEENNTQLRRLQKAKAACKTFSTIIPKIVAKLAHNQGIYKVNVPPKGTELDYEEVLRLKQQIKETYKIALAHWREQMKQEINEKIKRAVEKARNNPRVAPKLFYSSIRSKRGVQVPFICVKAKDGTIVTGKDQVLKEIRQQTQDRYTSKCQQHELNRRWFETERSQRIREKIKTVNEKLMRPIEKKEIEKIISKLKKKKTVPGLLPAEIFKISEKEISGKLEILFNRCLLERKIPQNWKDCILTYVYKKGDTSVIDNYRPINMSKAIYKIFMTIMNNRLLEIVEETNLLSNMQSGFRPRRSTHMRIQALIRRIEDAKQRNKHIYVTYCDLKFAYDMVEHWALWQVLEGYGFNTDFIKLLQNIFDGGNTKVSCPWGLTDEVYLNRGVKQGCPMSPLLFLIFINPLIDLINERIDGYSIAGGKEAIGAYCDDMVIHTEDWNRMSEAIQVVQDYCDDLGMELNLGKDENDKSKTVYTTNDKNHKELYVKIRGNQERKVPCIAKDESYSYLGIWMNLELNWFRTMNALKANLIRYLEPLKWRCFSARQTVDAINKIFVPMISYRMAVIPFPRKWLSSLDNIIAWTVNFKLGIRFKSSKYHLYQSNEESGLQLLSLEQSQMTAITRSLFSSMNGIDDDLRRVLEDASKNHSLWFEFMKMREIR